MVDSLKEPHLVRNIGYSLNLYLHSKQEIGSDCGPRRLRVGEERGVCLVHIRIVVQIAKVDGCLKHVF